MKALILAAGRGQRLLPHTADCPKCLLSLGSETILEHQLARLSAAGVSEVTVVAGFGVDAVRRRAAAAGPPALSVRVVYNPVYALADNLISLWSARAEIADDILLLNGDDVFHPDVPRLLVDGPAVPCRLLVDRTHPFVGDDMKVEVCGDRLVRIGKDLCSDRACARSIGMMRFRGEGSRRLRQVLEDAVQGERALCGFYLDGVQRLADAGVPVLCRDVGGLPWADIDTEQDLLDVRAGYSRYTGVAERVDDLAARAVGGAG